MKKIFKLLILGISLTLTSCDFPTISKSDLPIEVVSLKEANKFDTILQIKTEDKVFNFDKNKEYIGTYDLSQKNSTFLLVVVVMILLVIIGIILPS